MPFYAAVGLIAFLSAVLVQAIPQGRIVGGEDAVEGQFPYQVSIRMLDEHICGGSIISRDYILTAGHCVGGENSYGQYKTYKPKVFTILAGTTNRLTGGVIRQVMNIEVHKDFGNFLNDIALLRLSAPLDFSTTIKAIPLASSETPIGSSVIISGWGSVRNYGDSPIQLKWNVLSCISQSQCEKDIGFFPDRLLCLAHSKNNGACSGDSGGPATYNNELIGIAGFVTDGCGSTSPDGFTNVFSYLEWIKDRSDL